MSLTIKQIEKISKALGDKHRLNILQYISSNGGCGQCSKIQEVIDLAQPSVSHHIKILIDSGLIDDEKEGRNHKYNLNSALMNDYIGALKNLQCELGNPVSK
ncbi:ArsR/SmtB family transcription factor [Flavitalea flava]